MQSDTPSRSLKTNKSQSHTDSLRTHENTHGLARQKDDQWTI